MKMNENSNAQIEVWEWKETINKKYEHMETKEALKKIMIESIEVSKKYNLLPVLNNEEEIKSAQG